MKTTLRLLAAVLVCAPTFAHSEPVKLKFAVFSPDAERLFNTVKKPFAAAVNAASGGAIEIELYPNGALGRAPQQQAQMVIDGVADIGFIVPPFTPGRFPDSEVLELPGLFQDLAEGTRVYTRLVEAGVLRDYGDFFPIAMWATPPFSLHSNFPISSLKDVRAKKVRGSGVIQIETLEVGRRGAGRHASDRSPGGTEPAHHRCLHLAAGGSVRLRPRSRHQPPLLRPARRGSACDRHEPEEVREPSHGGSGRHPSPQHGVDQQALYRLHAGVRPGPHRAPASRIRSAPSCFPTPPTRRRRAWRSSR